MKRFKLTTQINLLFSLVTIIIGLIFVFVLEFSRKNEAEAMNKLQLIEYFDDVQESLDKNEIPVNNRYNGHIIIKNKSIKYSDTDIFGDNQAVVDEFIGKVVSTLRLSYVNRTFAQIQFKSDRIFFVVSFTTISAVPVGVPITSSAIEEMTIVFTNNAFIRSFSAGASAIMRIIFLLLLAAGNVIILTWSRSLANRIRKLEKDIRRLVDLNYEQPIIITGNDEITDLAIAVDEMRTEIFNNENTKQEMLQNLSHDFKTPISVIRSYAEAIAEGVSEPSDAKVIIKQADTLNEKVGQLLVFNKLAYIKDESLFEKIKLKEIIANVVNNHKYQSNIDIVTELDDSIFIGIPENYYVIISNILDNGLRYAKTKVVIKLKNNVLTFFNDGKSIDDKYIEEGFKPYEKGDKGQFGLGMSIVQKTLTHFRLRLVVQNVRGGVLFLIKPID